MEILSESGVDESESPISGELAGPGETRTPIEASSSFDIATIQWNWLRNGARIPTLASAELSNGTFRCSRSMQIVWHEGFADQAVTHMGKELVREFGVSAADVWPGSSDPNALPSLLRRLSEHAIRWERPISLKEDVISGAGMARKYRVLALPFAVVQTSEKLVVTIFDWADEGMQYSDGYIEIDDAETPAFPDRTISPPAEDVLLLEQEWVPNEIPAVPAQKNSNLPYFVVSMTEQQKPGQSQPVDRVRKGQLDDNAGRTDVDPSKVRPAVAEPAAVSQSGIRQEPEPLLLTEEVEPVGESAPLLRNDLDLAASLETARGHASAAMTNEERSHFALYAAISAAHDFSLCALEEPDEYQAMLDAAGLKVQSRAPFTPVVKLVFGVCYDRTRLAEYAAALAHAHRVGVSRGCLADYLAAFEGGIKALVRAERQQRRQSATAEHDQFDRVKDRLRKAQPQTFDALDPGEEEFVLVLARRLPDGAMAMVGKVPEDERLLSRAARAFLSK